MQHETAEQVNARLGTHEAVCAERYGTIIKSLEAAAKRIGRLEILVVVVAGSVIAGMGGLILTLLRVGGHS